MKRWSQHDCIKALFQSSSAKHQNSTWTCVDHSSLLGGSGVPALFSLLCRGSQSQSTKTMPRSCGNGPSGAQPAQQRHLLQEPGGKAVRVPARLVGDLRQRRPAPAGHLARVRADRAVVAAQPAQQPPSPSGSLLIPNRSTQEGSFCPSCHRSFTWFSWFDICLLLA